MSKGLKVSWFEIPALDMERAIAFYEQVFDISIKPVDFGGLVMGWFPPSEEAGAATGSLVKHEGYVPDKEGIVLYFDCEDLSVELGRVAEAGGKVLQEKTEIGEGHGYMGLLLDSEGNRIALHCN